MIFKEWDMFVVKACYLILLSFNLSSIVMDLLAVAPRLPWAYPPPPDLSKSLPAQTVGFLSCCRVCEEDQCCGISVGMT